jgi:outer membrane immunogenic protein
MKTRMLVFGLAFCGLSAMPATAQEIPQAYAAEPCCPVEHFDGLYVGGNFGVLSHTARRNDNDGFLTDNSGWTATETDLVGGLQLGRDWQRGNKVVGLVGEWNFSDVESLIEDNPNDTFSDNFVHSELEWFSTIRGRAGVAVDDVLFYVSAGPAVAEIETTWQDDDEVFNFSDTRWGWAGSVGTEFKCGCNTSVGLDLMYMHFDSTTNTFEDSGGTDFAFSDNDSAFAGRILMNYRF